MIVVFSCAWRFDVANSISVFSSIISIFTAVLAFFTWSNLQKLQSDSPKQSDSTGNMSAILIVDIGPKGIKGNVLPFCEGNRQPSHKVLSFRLLPVVVGTGQSRPTSH